MKLKNRVFVLPAVILALLICAGIALYIVSVFYTAAQPAVEFEPPAEPEPVIDVRTIEREIKSIGDLCTSEYSFTAIDTISKDRIDLWFVKLPWTESSAILKYSGTVTAGIDFTQVTVEADHGSRTLCITLPPARIISSELDFKSFELLDVKNGLFNSISIEDTNKSLDVLVETETAEAIDSGILDRAQLNAEDIVTNLFRSICSAEGYELLPVVFEAG